MLIKIASLIGDDFYADDPAGVKQSRRRAMRGA
jgi:hypothetical protein